jgi:hypothetical protein
MPGSGTHFISTLPAMAHMDRAEGFDQEQDLSSDDDLDIVSATKKTLNTDQYIKSELSWFVVTSRG